MDYTLPSKDTGWLNRLKKKKKAIYMLPTRDAHFKCTQIETEGIQRGIS